MRIKEIMEGRYVFDTDINRHTSYWAVLIYLIHNEKIRGLIIYITAALMMVTTFFYGCNMDHRWAKYMALLCGYSLCGSSYADC